MANITMATETAGKPAAPRSKAGAAKGARALGSVASAAREKLRVRERQTAMLVGQIAAQLEDKQPGRIFAVKLTCTRYKSTGTIVFNQRRVRASLNEHGTGDDCDDDDSDGEDGGTELSSGPPAPKVAVPKPVVAAKAAAAGAVDTVKQRGGRDVAGSSAGWQQPRRPARQQPQDKPKTVQKSDRNAISARGSGKLDPGQRTTLAKSISSISKEVCPSSAFTVTRHLPIDGEPLEVQMLPTCMAAEALRHDATASGACFKRCFLTGNGAELREMLAPIKPTSYFRSGDASDDVDMGFDLFDQQQ